MTFQVSVNCKLSVDPGFISSIYNLETPLFPCNSYTNHFNDHQFNGPRLKSKVCLFSSSCPKPGKSQTVPLSLQEYMFVSFERRQNPSIFSVSGLSLIKYCAGYEFSLPMFPVQIMKLSSYTQNIRLLPLVDRKPDKLLCSS